MARRAHELALAAAVVLTSACGDSNESNGADDNSPAASKADAGADASTSGFVSGPPLVAATQGSGCVEVSDTPPAFNNGVLLPDSYCDDTKCVVGNCDPKGETAPACNAFLLEAQGSFHAVRSADSGSFGLPPAPEKADDDACPGFMSSAGGGALNCCQRVPTQGEKPAIKMTGLALTRPANLAAAAVAESNKQSIEHDLYNWMMVLDSNADGALTVRSGNATPNTDGSFTSLEAPLDRAGKAFNADGAWSAPTMVPGQLSSHEDGTRALCVGPSASGKNQTMVIWFDDKFDFVRLALPLRSVVWDIPLSNDLVCSGLLTDSGFNLVAKMHSFLTVEDARKTGLALSKTADPINLCAYITGVKSCDGAPSTWSK